MQAKILFTVMLLTFFVKVNAQQTASFTDPRDNKIYKTVKIGNQVWMAENLAYKPSTGNYWNYDNNHKTEAKYGYWYDWKTANYVCPKGWHLPTDDEWKTLEISIGISQGTVNDLGFRSSEEGRKLKSQTGWYGNGNGTDETGFSVFPGGDLIQDSDCNHIGSIANFWTSTEVMPNKAWSRKLFASNNYIYRSNDDDQNYGFSVRCLKD